MKALYTIIRPIVTEKALKQGEAMKYAFYVHTKATKIDVKQAIKELYGHEVDTVQLMVMPVKKRNYGRKEIIKRKELKKAIVTLKGKKKIDVTKITKEKTK
jgi:large subunit ribosomal protein L23